MRLDSSIIISGGSYAVVDPSSTDVIWTYNLYTDKWEKHATTKRRVAPESFAYAVAVTIEGTIYTFGGRRYDDVATNELWTLSRKETGGFTWSFIKYQSDKESPSPRSGHTGWQYAGKLWIFGGHGPSPQSYLNGNGDVVGVTVITNNQLLSYDPNTNKWTNPQCSGQVPSPRSGHSSTIIREKLFLLGGYDGILSFDDFFQLNMHSLTWTRIQTAADQHHPGASYGCTLTATTDNQLVFHMPANDTRIMDLTSHSWKLYTARKDHNRYYHTATLGLSSNVIIIGGYSEESIYHIHEKHDIIFHVMLEPKCLQKLAAHTIYKHQADLSWKCLPKKLIARLGISDKKQGPASSSCITTQR